MCERNTGDLMAIHRGHPEHKPNQRGNHFKNNSTIHHLVNQSSSTNTKEVPMMQEMQSIMNGLSYL